MLEVLHATIDAYKNLLFIFLQRTDSNIFTHGFCSCNPPGSAPSHRAGLESGTLAREAGALPRRLKATASKG